MSEVTNNEKTEQTIINKQSIMNSFKEEFSSSVIPIYVNSLKRCVNFREVSVKEQKSLSKTMIQNENRKDIVYDTQCALINKLCLEDGFDIYKLTEFDRIRILMEIYSSNYIQNDIKFKCPECGVENVYKIDFEKIAMKMNEFSLEPQSFSVEDKTRVYNFNINYPSVYTVSDFYKEYFKHYKNVSQKEREVLDNMGNIEYMNLFITDIEIINKVTKNKNKADLSLLSLSEIQQIFALLPQNIIFDDKKGVIQFITTEFVEKINNVFQYEKCAQCGHQTNEGIGDLVDFF